MVGGDGDFLRHVQMKCVESRFRSFGQFWQCVHLSSWDGASCCVGDNAISRKHFGVGQPLCVDVTAALSDVIPEDDKAMLFYVVEVSEFDGLKVNFFYTCVG